jgi:hypothetical protein
LPDDAGIGFTPHSEAKAASERSRSELLPATTNRVAAVVGPTPKASTRVGAIDRVSRSISAFRFRTSSLRWRYRQARERRVYFAAALGSSRREGRKFLHLFVRALVVRPSSVSRSLAGAVTTRAFIWLPAWVRDFTAESLALLSIRIISTSPSPDLGVASTTPESTPRAAISASVGPLFPLR